MKTSDNNEHDIKHRKETYETIINKFVSLLYDIDYLEQEIADQRIKYLKDNIFGSVPEFKKLEELYR
jgi:hypothetical protein